MIDFNDPKWEVIPDAIRVHLPKRSAEYALRLLAEYSPEPVQPPPPAPVAKPKTKGKRGENLKNGDRHSPKKFDYHEIARLWSSGMLVKDVAATVGCGMATVRTALREVQPEGYTGRSGRKPQPECSRGHDMAVHGRPATNGGRYCSECKRENQRVKR